MLGAVIMVHPGSALAHQVQRRCVPQVAVLPGYAPLPPALRLAAQALAVATGCKSPSLEMEPRALVEAQFPDCVRHPALCQVALVTAPAPVSMPLVCPMVRPAVGRQHIFGKQMKTMFHAGF